MDDLIMWHQNSNNIEVASEDDVPPNDNINDGYPNNENNIHELLPCTAEEIMELGYPSGDERSTLRKLAYVCGVNGNNKWVSECFTRDHCSVIIVSRRDIQRCRGNRYEEDTDIEAPVDTGLRLADFSNWPSGTQKGHLAAVANHRYSCKVCGSTFFTSNIVPMYPEVNKTIGIIENRARYIAKVHGKVYIITGSHFYHKRRPEAECSSSSLMIPDGIFKVIVHKVYGNYDYQVEAYYIENDTGEKKTKTRIKLQELEHMTGLNFLSNISRNVIKETEIKPENKVEVKDEWLPIRNDSACVNREFDDDDYGNVDVDNPPNRRRSRNVGK